MFLLSLFKKIKNYWILYKTSKPTKKFIVFSFIFYMLLYRQIICHALAIPLLFFYLLFYPFIKLRFIKLHGSHIGHFAFNTELFLIQAEMYKNDKFINIYYVINTPFEPTISNKYLLKLWKRIIFILPIQCSVIASILDKYIRFVLPTIDYNLNGIKERHEQKWSEDGNAFLASREPFLSFTIEEEEYAKKKLIETFNIKPTDKFICLLVRCSAYNHEHPERNANLQTYLKACKYLAEQGYYVLRMGKLVNEPLSANHPRIIDYANSHIRSDFMDIYLSAKCYFFITTGAGLDSVAQIFRRPILFTNYFNISKSPTWSQNYLIIYKNWKLNNGKKLLTFKEQIFYLHSHPDLVKQKGFFLSAHIIKSGLTCINNSEIEILEAVQEMEERLNNIWKEKENQKSLHSLFWKMFITNIDPELQEPNNPLYNRDKIFAKVGSKFLTKYQFLL